MDRASDKLVRSTTTNVSDSPETAREAEALAAQEAGLLDGTVEMIVSRRLFSAAIKMAATTNEGVLERCDWAVTRAPRQRRSRQALPRARVAGTRGQLPRPPVLAKAGRTLLVRPG